MWNSWWSTATPTKYCRHNIHTDPLRWNVYETYTTNAVYQDVCALTIKYNMNNKHHKHKQRDFPVILASPW